MNDLKFTPSRGLALNGQHIKHTFDHHWQALVKRLKGRANIIVTNEINLNANVENCGQMYAFHVPRSVGEGLLKNGHIKSRVSSWRMLGPLSQAAERAVEQSPSPTLLANGDIILLAYRSSEDAELSYMVSYAHDPKTLPEAIDDARSHLTPA